MTGCFLQSLCSTGIFRAQGIFRTLSNIYDGKFYSQLCVTLVYLEPWHIQNPTHIQNTAEYLRWSILLRTLCNYSRFRGPIYSKLRIFRTGVCQLLFNILAIYHLLCIKYQRITVSTNKNMSYYLAIRFFSHSFVYDELNGFS